MTGSAQEDIVDCMSLDEGSNLLSLPVELLIDVLELCTLDSLLNVLMVSRLSYVSKRRLINCGPTDMSATAADFKRNYQPLQEST